MDFFSPPDSHDDASLYLLNTKYFILKTSQVLSTHPKPLKKILLLQKHYFIMAEPNNQQQLDIELTEEIAEGVYSNLAIITHSNAEFLIDFVRVMPGVPKAKVKSRILLTPFHTKRLLMALSENVQKFEEQFGNIEEGENTMNGFPMNYGGPTGMA